LADKSKHVTTSSVINFSFPDTINNSGNQFKKLIITIYEADSYKTVQEKTFKKVSEIADTVVGGVIETGEKVVKKVGKGEYGSGAKAVIKGVNDVSNKIAKQIQDLNGTPKITITLPLPNELQDSQTHEYSTETGIVKMIADKADATGIISKVMSQTSNLLNTQKILANPGYYQNYTGSQPRTFTFTFDFIVNNSDETVDMINIISALKKYSSPNASNGAFLVAPNFFDFSFSNETLRNLVNIRPSIITSVSTNYAASGILDTMMDGQPKHVTLSISITEMKTLTQQSW